MRTHAPDTVSVRTISSTMLLMGAFSLCMILALAAPWDIALAQTDATTSEPCSSSDAQRGTTVKGSKSNSDNRTMDAEATTARSTFHELKATCHPLTVAKIERWIAPQ